MTSYMCTTLEHSNIDTLRYSVRKFNRRGRRSSRRHETEQNLGTRGTVTEVEMRLAERYPSLEAEQKTIRGSIEAANEFGGMPSYRGRRKQTN